MQLLGKLEIKSKEKIIEFLSSESTGRIASVDVDVSPRSRVHHVVHHEVHQVVHHMYRGHVIICVGVT